MVSEWVQALRAVTQGLWRAEQKLCRPFLVGCCTRPGLQGLSSSVRAVMRVRKRTLAPLSRQHIIGIYWDFLVVQWLRLCTVNAEGAGSIPGQGAGSCMPKLKMPPVAMKAQHSQINIF